MAAFRLQTLVKLRESARDAERRRYAEALAADEALQHRERELSAESESLRDFVRTQNQKQVDIDRLIHAQRYGLLLDAQRKQMAEQRTQLEAEIERRRMSLVEADRNVRVLEKLREKHAERELQQDRKREERTLTEFAMRRPQEDGA